MRRAECERWLSLLTTRERVELCVLLRGEYLCDEGLAEHAAVMCGELGTDLEYLLLLAQRDCGELFDEETCDLLARLHNDESMSPDAVMLEDMQHDIALDWYGDASYGLL